ncbi:MAG: anhydro-N-acetylmuramic acid kinase [Alphaproteobacteria bacterium]|nr:anhydro-N-acetylmuramic acid kinase [Alphaproteobacteria bacterium]
MLAIGLMSGTSLDGVDAALIETDGATIARFGPSLTTPYEEGLRAGLRAVLGGRGDVMAMARALTLAHADAVGSLLAASGTARESVRVIGFHGQTIQHRPDEGITWQIGDSALLAERTGIDVIADFRRADMAAGGQGAPLVPVFHRALAAGLERPLAVLNIGGVANVTWIGRDGALVAFDTGPGGALLDDWVRRHAGQAFDAGGALAGSGTVHDERIAAVLRHPFFERPPPKSIDRDAFGAPAEGLGAADGAATLTALTARAVAHAVRHLPEPPRRWLVAGGGRRNATLMAALGRVLQAPVEPVGSVGWNGDALEAQAFGFLAVRSLRGLPLTEPSTTGVRRAVSGGALYRASSSSPSRRT